MKIFTLLLSRTKVKSYHTIENTDERIIKGILQNSNQIISELYQQNYLKVKKMVRTFKNTRLDPEDVFQEGMTRAILNIRNGKFRGESSFSTYLSSICRNICLKQLSKKSEYELNDNYDVIEEDNHFEIIQQVLKLRQQLGVNCRTIIDLRFTLEENELNKDPNKCASFDEIAKKTQITAINARQRFKRCLDKLRELAQQSPDFNEYFIPS